MASMAMASLALPKFQLNSSIQVCSFWDDIPALPKPPELKFCRREMTSLTRSLLSSNPRIIDARFLAKPISAVGSGLEASVTDPKGNAVTLKNVKIVVESEDENQMQLRVDLTGEETQKVFDIVLTDLAKTAPPIPGFRRQKGGKTSKVPKSFLLQMLGEDRVTKFVIQEIVTSTMADYVKKENLKVKDMKISTTQTAEELKAIFVPGTAFGFNAVLDLESEASEADT